ncbi:hypothetical protein RUND412_004461 [Rhizina undulata]
MFPLSQPDPTDEEVASSEKGDNSSLPLGVPRKRQASSYISSDLGSKKPPVSFARSEGSSGSPEPSDLRTLSPLGSPKISPPPPTRAYIVGIYNRLFSQRGVKGRVLRADYKRDVRGGAREWGRDLDHHVPGKTGPLVENLHDDEDSSGGNDDEDSSGGKDDEDSSGGDDGEN